MAECQVLWNRQSKAFNARTAHTERAVHCLAESGAEVEQVSCARLGTRSSAAATPPVLPLADAQDALLNGDEQSAPAEAEPDCSPAAQ